MSISLTDESRALLTLLAQNIEIARCRRRLSQKLLCEKAMITPQTYKRLMNGEPGVSLGVVLSIAQAMNLESLMLYFLDPDRDTLGKSLEDASRQKKFVGGDDVDTNF